MTGHRDFTPPASGWTEHAACRTVHTNIMYPVVNSGPGAGDRVNAKAATALRICAECPVTRECEQHWNTLPTEEQIHGIWFGTTPNDRATQRRANRRQRTNERNST